MATPHPPQTYDRDHFEVNGRRDDYSHLDDGQPTATRTGIGGDVTTSAKAEGAIEGARASVDKSETV